MRIDSAIRWGATVVAAACAIAVAVLVGASLRPSRDDTRAACAGQLAKLGRALRLYADDNEGHFPVTQTPAAADRRLFPLLEQWGIVRDDFYCPALTEADSPPYTYHCYRDRGSGDWPRWMPDEHIVTLDSPPGSWLMADHLGRDTKGPHSQTEKAYNYLCVDGRVRFKVGRPREVYE
jgi:hypothetical protein